MHLARYKIIDPILYHTLKIKVAYTRFTVTLCLPCFISWVLSFLKSCTGFYFFYGNVSSNAPSMDWVQISQNKPTAMLPGRNDVYSPR